MELEYLEIFDEIKKFCSYRNFKSYRSNSLKFPMIINTSSLYFSFVSHIHKQILLNMSFETKLQYMNFTK